MLAAVNCESSATFSNLPQNIRFRSSCTEGIRRGRFAITKQRAILNVYTPFATEGKGQRAKSTSIYIFDEASSSLQWREVEAVREEAQGDQESISRGAGGDRVFSFIRMNLLSQLWPDNREQLPQSKSGKILLALSTEESESGGMRTKRRTSGR